MDAYAILEVVGEGSFGRVFKAKHKQTQAIVALKLIRKIGRSPRDLENLRRECEILQELRHPNIISLMASFETNSEVVVVMEFAAGELFATIGTGSQLNRENMLQVTCDLLSALYYLHSHRILHRDIKPQNILLGVDGRVKLCDFGFARIMNLNTYLLTSIKGTPLYMAPEIIQEKPYDHSADLWSLGCILYELVTGTPLFNTSSIIELVKKVTTEPIQFPKSDRLYPECQSFMEGLLQKDPRRRLTWPEILDHEFVRDKLDLHLAQSAMVPLTHPLSESQERRREEQRQDLESKSRGQGLSLVKAVQQMEMEKQRKIREAMIVMEAARRHRVCPLPPADTFQKYFKTGLTEAVEPTVGTEDSAATPPEPQRQEPEEDDVEDVPIASRARRRESMLSSIEHFESDIRKFAGVPESPEKTLGRCENDADDDDRTIVGDESPEVNRTCKPSFPIDETSPVHRGEWETFLRSTLDETKAAPAREPLASADIAALLVPLRASEIDPVVVSGIIRIFMLAVLRAAHDVDGKKQLLLKFVECGTVGNVLSCITRIASSVEGEPDEEVVATLGTLFEFLAGLFVLDEWPTNDCLATLQFTQTWRYYHGTRLDVFPALRKCLSWNSVGPKTLGAAMCMLWRMWSVAGEDLKGSIVDLFLSLKARLFELVGVVGEGGSKQEVDAAVQALTLLSLVVQNGVLPDAKNDDKLRDKLVSLTEGTEAGTARVMLKKGAAMLLGALDKKRRVC